MKWYWVTAKNYDCKSHAIPEELVDGVINNMLERGVAGMNKTSTKAISFDLPGIAYIHRHMHTIQVDGLEIDIPATDVEEILEKAENLSVRNEIGKSYYKLHGFHRCICLTPEQRQELVDALKAILPEANAIASAENEEFNKKLVGTHKNILVKPRPVKKPKGKA